MKNTTFLFLCAIGLFVPPALAESCKSGLMGTWEVMKELEVNDSNQAADWIFEDNGKLTARVDSGQEHESTFLCKEGNVLIIDNGQNEVPGRYYIAGEDRDRLIIAGGGNVVILRKLQ